MKQDASLKTPPRHARLIELIRQENLAAAACPTLRAREAELEAAQSFIAGSAQSLQPIR